MALEIMKDDVKIIQGLSDYPNQEEGLTSGEMKAKFDEAAVKLQGYINNSVVPAVNDKLSASEMSGAVADAVEQTLGSITPDKIGAAPAGYIAENTITSASLSLDNLIKQQFSKTSASGMRYFMFNNTVSNDIPTAIWVGTIYKHSESDGKVELRNIYQGRKHEIHRFLSNGSWGEWEWVNPPMEFGKEYRTINRYNTKSVYTKVIKHTLTEDVGNSSGATNIQIDGGCSVVDAVVSVTAFYINTSGVKFPIPAMGGSGNVFLGINRVAAGTLVTPVVVYKDTLTKGAHFEIIYEYTKTTD